MRLSLKTLLKLMDLRTLVAGVLPVILGSIYSFYRYEKVNILDFFIILIGIILLQSSTNMINDLYDYARGADDTGRADEKALASGEATKKQVKQIIYTFLLTDIVIAIFYSATHHWAIGLVAIVAVLVMYKYSGGKKPISYTPFGELVAGSIMGFGIMTTVIFIQSGVFNWETLFVALPTAIFIGTILLTNNVSDWNEDKRVGRRTLPIVIGISKAERLWIFNCYSLIGFTVIFFLLGFYPILSLINVIISMPYQRILHFTNIDKTPENKGRMMGLIGTIGVRYHFAVVIGMVLQYLFIALS